MSISHTLVEVLHLDLLTACRPHRSSHVYIPVSIDLNVGDVVGTGVGND